MLTELCSQTGGLVSEPGEMMSDLFIVPTETIVVTAGLCQITNPAFYYRPVGLMLMAA